MTTLRHKLSLLGFFLLLMGGPALGQEILLQGVVTNRATGDPIPGALVRGVETDASGSYALTGQQIGSVTGRLLFEADDFFALEIPFAISEPLPVTLDVQLAPGPGSPLLEGVVTNALSGAPIANANLFCSSGTITNNSRRNAQTDEFGDYSYESWRFFEGAATGFSCSFIIISAPGFLSSTIFPGQIFEPPFPARFDIALIPRDQVVLEVLVVDRQSGIPIEGAIVRGVQTDVNGIAPLTGNQLGATTGRLLVEAQGFYAFEKAFSVQPPVPSQLLVELLAGPGVPLLEGQVRDALTGDPISGANLFCSSGAITNNSRRNVQTDPTGNYFYDSDRFFEVADSGFSCSFIIVSASGFLGRTIHPNTLFEPPFPARVDFDLIPRTEIVLEGIVTDRDTGILIVGTRVGNTETAADGTYELTGNDLGRETGRLLFEADQYFAQESSYAIAPPLPARLDVELAPGPGVPLLEGVVRDQLTGRPIPGANLFCSSGAISNNSRRNVQTDESGVYRYESWRFFETGGSGFNCSFIKISAPGFLSSTIFPNTFFEPPFPGRLDADLFCVLNCTVDTDGDTIEDDQDNCPSVANPAQQDTDLDGAGDLCDVCPSDSSDSCQVDGSAAAEISSSEGGTVTTPDGNLSIDIEPGDLSADTTISVTQTVVNDPEVDLSIGPNPGLGKALAVYDLEPDGLVFSQPVTLTIRQDVSNLNPNQRRRLDLYRLVDSDGDGIGDTFDALMADCQVDENPAATFTAICSVDLDHFSTYALSAPLDSDNDGVPDLFGELEDICPEQSNVVEGFLSFGALAAEDELDTPFPPAAIKAGRTLPLRLRFSCGETPVTAADSVRPPRLVSLIRLAEDGAPVEALIQDSGAANANGLEFRSSEDLWIFNLSTKGLARISHSLCFSARKAGI